MLTNKSAFLDHQIGFIWINIMRFGEPCRSFFWNSSSSSFAGWLHSSFSDSSRIYFWDLSEARFGIIPAISPRIFSRIPPDWDWLDSFGDSFRNSYQKFPQVFLSGMPPGLIPGIPWKFCWVPSGIIFWKNSKNNVGVSSPKILKRNF